MGVSKEEQMEIEEVGISLEKKKEILNKRKWKFPKRRKQKFHWGENRNKLPQFQISFTDLQG